MSVLGRLVDARNTVEGKVLSVFMAALLIVSTFNVSAWAAEKSQESSETLVTEVNDKQAPEQPKAEPEKPAAQPEADEPATEPEVEKTTAQLENATPRPEAEAPAQAPAAPVEEKAADVALKLKVQDATLTYDGKAVAADAKELTVPAGKDVKFTVAAADGFQLGAKAVKLVNAAGVECELAANAAGEYTVPAEKLEAGATIQVTAEPVAAEEPAAPTQPATPVVPADDPTEPSDEPATPEVPEAPSDSATTEPGTILDDFLDIFGGGSTLSINGGKDITLEVGASKTVSSNNGDHSLVKNHSWTSSDGKIATVNGNGPSATVKGVSAGVVTVTHSYDKNGYKKASEKITVTVKATSAPVVTYKANGGQGSDVSVEATWGSQLQRYAVTLPDPADIGISKEGAVFIGWSTADSGAGTNNVANTEFTVTENTTLYAIWLDESAESSRTNTAYFYIRKNGEIQKEPAGYPSADYYPTNSAMTLRGSLRQPIAVNNNDLAVLANLKTVPTDTQIQQMLQGYGVAFDPATQYVHWYVIKSRDTKDNTWNVDGVILSKSAHLVTYDANGGVANIVPAGREYMKDVTVNVDFSVIPERTDHVFLGWDRSSSAITPEYPKDQAASFTMPDEAVTLYAIWRSRSSVSYTYTPSPEEGGSVTLSRESVKPESGNAEGSTAEAGTGYKFDGWYTGETLLTEENAAANNVLLSTDGKTIIPQKNSSGLYTGGDFVARFSADPEVTKSLAATVDYKLGDEVQQADRVDLKATVQWLEPDTLSTEGVAAKEYKGWKLGSITVNGTEVEALPATVNNGDAVVYNYVARDDTKYTVEYYTRGLGYEGYSLYGTPEEHEGTTGSTATADIKNIEGFYYVSGATSGIIAADGSLVLRLYYDRETYVLTYDYGEAPAGASSLPFRQVAQYGQTVEVAPNASAPGWTFSGWDRQGEFTMPAGDVTIKGSWTADFSAIAATPYEGVYDAAVHYPTVSGALDSDVITYSADLRNVTNGAAPVEITITRGTAVHKVESTVTITPRPVVVAADDNSKIYGTADPELTANAHAIAGNADSGLLNNDTVDYEVTRAAGEEAGTYAITPAGDAIQGNYTVTYEPAVFTITPAGGNVIEGINIAGGEGMTKVYDGQGATIEATALREGSTILYSLDGVNFSEENPLTSANVGSYDVYVMATNPNYADTPVIRRTVTITPAQVTVTAVTGLTKVAGTADPTFTADVEGLVNGESADLISYTVSREAGEAAGSYAVTATGAALQGNYAVRYIPGAFTITPVPVPPAPVTPVTPTPAPAGPAAPAAAAPAPVAAAVVPAAAAAVPAAETILEDLTPLAETPGTPEVIADDETPMAAFDHPHCWVHYWIFLGIFLTLVYAAVVIARRMNYVRKIDKYEDNLTGGQKTGDARVTKPVAGGMEA